VILRSILAVLAALVANFLVVALCELALGAAFPPPAGISLEDPIQMATFVKTVPATAFLGLVVGWTAGAFAAAAAGFYASGRQTWAAFAGAAINFLGVLVTVATIRHPLWVTAVGLFMPLIAASTIPRLRTAQPA
jgi:hypothetical protein